MMTTEVPTAMDIESDKTLLNEGPKSLTPKRSATLYALLGVEGVRIKSLF